MPYYGDAGGSSYYGYGTTGPFANHSSLMSSIGRYHNPIAARYSPHLSTISETPFVKLRRYGPTVPTSATTSLSRPRRIIDTADIDVTKPPSRSLDHRHQQQQQRHRLRRDRPTIKIRSQALKDNPALREYNERHEKTVGEMLVEKFLIKDKSAREAEPAKIKLYHQASLLGDGQPSKDRSNDILAAIRHRITRKMTRRRSSVDAVPLDPEQIEREAALQAAQAEALDTLVAEELAEAEMEVRKGTFTKRHSLVMLPVDISEASDSEDEADEDERKSSELPRKHATAKKKRRRKSIDKYSQSDEEEDAFSIAESIIEEEEFEWDDRDKCDDIKSIMPKEEATITVPEQKRVVSPGMEKKEKLDEVGNRLKELRKEVRKLEKKERDIKHVSTTKHQCQLKKDKLTPKIEHVKVEIVKPKAGVLKAKLDDSEVKTVEATADDVIEREIIPESEKTTDKILEEQVRNDGNLLINKEAIKPKMEESKKAAEPKEEELKKAVEPVIEESKKMIEPKAEELQKAAKPKIEKPMKETEEIVPELITPKIHEAKKELAKSKKEIAPKQIDSREKRVDSVKIEETTILERKDDDKNLRLDKSGATNTTLEQKKALDTKDKDEQSKLDNDNITIPPKGEENIDSAIHVESTTKAPKDDGKLKVKERKLKEKSPKPDRNKLKRTISAPQHLPPEPESPCFRIEACNSVGDMSTLYVKSTSSAEAIRNIEQFRESIRLPAPKSRTTVETEVVLPVRKPYVRDTSRNSVYLALKPMRKDADAKSSNVRSIISEEGESERMSDEYRQVDEKSSSRARGAKEEFASWWDEIPEEVQHKTIVESGDKVVEQVIEKKLQVEAKDHTAVAKKADSKVTPAVNKVTPSKAVDKAAEAVRAEEKKAKVKVEVKPDSKIKVDNAEVKLNDSISTDSGISEIAAKPQVVEDKSATDQKVKEAAVEKVTEAPVKETPVKLPRESQKKSETLPRVASDKAITPSVDVDNDNNKTSSRDVTGIAEAATEETATIIAAAAKKQQRDEARSKRKVDAQAIMKIEKQILKEAESPDKILTTAALLPAEKEDDEEQKKLGLDGNTKSNAATATEIDFWSEIETPPPRDDAVEPQQQTNNNLKLDLSRIDLPALDDLPTPLIEDQDATPVVECPATPSEKNLEQVPPINLALTEEERRSTIKYNGAQLDELSGTVKKISKWGNHDNLTSLDSNVTPVASKEVSPAVSTASSLTKNKITKKKKSTTAKKAAEACAKRTGESAKKTSAKVKAAAKKATTTTPPPPQPPPPQVKPAMSASGSPRNTPVQRPADLQKLFYTTPAILLTATPRDLRKVRRAKAKKKKPPTRTPSMSSDSTGSTRSTATTSTEEGSNCEEDVEQKRLNSTRSNDSGFDGSPRLSTPSQSAENQRNAEGDHFHHSGRITPPATNLPRFKKYEVTDFNFLKVLGKGSFGKVLLAELRGTECVYAVKCLKKDVVLEDDDVECTLIERKVLTLATRHPYLCHLFCTFQTESHLFFVMEYLNGGDLMFHIQKSGRFSEPRAKFYAAEIWSGLIFLHKKGIVYRDLKLDNVLLDFEGHIRIADFGMCKLQIFLDRTADTFCGTPDYMAPEIIKGLKYNQAVDWWSFGVLLYEMLTGQSPFSGCDEDELFWSICNERPFIPRYLGQSSTDMLVCLLEKDAGKRIPGHEIACHPFFCNIAWDKLERRVLEPPFKPAVEHTLDTRYFDTAFTAERPRLTPVPEEILTSMDQAVFRGFSYTNPNATD
ncbi:titin-like [Phymastichus coffea]|uniref:titin-like n=1 Tax=Phymastichus coffea TaxID=108790 RepID=UPI00273B8439|nr:titin-like [Phymastichus coffea]